MSQPNIKVLIIDKEEENLETLELLLDKHYIVSSLCESNNYIEHIKNTRPDIVILNPVMYGLNPSHVCRAVKEDADHPGHVLFISDFGSADDAIWAYKVGADDYIKKPFMEDLILQKIAKQVKSRTYHKAVASEVSEAKEMAMSAMRSTSDLGDVVSYILGLSKCHDYDELAVDLMGAIEKVGLTPQIQMRGPQGIINYRCDNTSLEAQMMSKGSSGRISDFGDTLLINGTAISVLAKYPSESNADLANCRDNLVVMVNAAEGRMQTIIAHEEIEGLRSTTIDDSLATAELEMRKINENFEIYTHSMWRSLDHLKLEIENLFMSLSLEHEQEEFILDIIDRHVEELHQSDELKTDIEIAFSKISTYMHTLSSHPTHPAEGTNSH